MLMYQRIATGGPSTFDVPPGPDPIEAHYQPVDVAEPSSDYVRLANLDISYDFAGAELTSATSFWNRSLVQSQDTSEVDQNIYGIPTFYPTFELERDLINQFSEELRIASTGSGPFSWLAGAFFSNMRSTWFQSGISPAVTNYVYGLGFYLPITAADNPEGIIYLGNVAYDMKQYAGFADLTYAIVPTVKLSVGGRYYKYDTTVNATQSGIFTQSVDATPTYVNSETSASGFNPKVNVSWEPTDDLTLYGTVSKGFRPGGINLPLPAAGPNSCTAALAAIGVNSNTNNYGADSVWNYEIGEKARVADRNVSINSAVYYIRWNNIQQLVPLACGYFFTVNAGDARSYGSEVEVQAKLSREWSVSLTGAYTNAEINNPEPQLGIAPGTPLLNIPKYTASAAINYHRPLAAGLEFTGRVASNYASSITDEAFTYVRLPAYALLNARFGLSADRWDVYLTATNLTNKIAELTANNTSLSANSPDLTRISTNQPRTIGVEVGVKF